ncbi:MAG: hypothetical protein JWQ27_1158 [Ferruginibacter sp.]|nr:hypothetical protein [Ferruginibacter sp.]
MIALKDFEVYKVAMEIGRIVFATIQDWNHFHKETLGKQFLRSADSIALNIAEGYGRFFYKENRNFNYYSRGSAYECATCLKKAKERSLVSPDQENQLRILFTKFFKLINCYIKSIGPNDQ